MNQHGKEMANEAKVVEALCKVVKAIAGLSNNERLRILRAAKEATNTRDEVKKSPGEFVKCRRALINGYIK